VAGGGMAIVAADNTQCRFNINSYRMVFVVNKENLLYKRQALHRARQVCCIDAQTSTYFKFRASLFTLVNHACWLYNNSMNRFALTATVLQCTFYSLHFVWRMVPL